MTHDTSQMLEEDASCVRPEVIAKNYGSLDATNKIDDVHKAFFLCSEPARIVIKKLNLYRKETCHLSRRAWVMVMVVV